MDGVSGPQAQITAIANSGSSTAGTQKAQNDRTKYGLARNPKKWKTIKKLFFSLNQMEWKD